MDIKKKDWTGVHNAIKAYQEHESGYQNMFDKAMKLDSDTKCTEMIMDYDNTNADLRRRVTQEYLIAIGVDSGLNLPEHDLYNWAVYVSGFEENNYE